jgi:hypothetical protein
MKNAVFWDMTPCYSRRNRRFGGTYRLNHRCDKNLLGRNNVNSNYYLKFQLLVTANVAPSSPTLC